MNQHDACVAARKFLGENGLAKFRIKAVDRHESYEGPRIPIWVVRAMHYDASNESGDWCIIVVDENTGEVTFAETL